MACAVLMRPRMRSLSLVGLLLLSSSLALFGCDDTTTSDESNVTSVVKEETPEAQALRALLNDRATSFDVLRAGGVTSSPAKALLAYRDGPDGVANTEDDNLFDTVAEVDDVKGVGPATIKSLVKLADAKGYVAAEKAKTRSVIFSPQPASESHNREVARIIGQAERSIDVAMYSYSDAGIGAALDAAVDRGVKVRFLFQTASADKKLSGSQLQSSRSGKLEAMGVDVRWVNKDHAPQVHDRGRPA